MKKVILTMGIVGLLGLGYLYKTNTGEFSQLIDKVSPFVKTEEVYVKTSDNAGQPEGDYGGYRYHQTVYRYDGSPLQLEYYALKRLTPNRYLKITTKGRFVKEYEEVQQTELPDNLRAKLA